MNHVTNNYIKILRNNTLLEYLLFSCNSFSEYLDALSRINESIVNKS